MAHRSLGDMHMTQCMVTVDVHMRCTPFSAVDNSPDGQYWWQQWAHYGAVRLWASKGAELAKLGKTPHCTT